ncbi:hypothetical protein AQUCO_01600202v1 [Aquilegia coerulea]|uniref:Uncharacterized protein n=1 Tax=Aquilegia coerulea TaxID=218851 RepID=A0A2G5DQM9_AQUCA|nr:hypothetical protein AQUCO_01600202v1 [Aquilegia coerulea]
MASKKLSLITDLKNLYGPWTIKVRVFKFWEGIYKKNRRALRFRLHLRRQTGIFSPLEININFFFFFNF